MVFESGEINCCDFIENTHIGVNNFWTLGYRQETSCRYFKWQCILCLYSISLLFYNVIILTRKKKHQQITHTSVGFRCCCKHFLYIQQPRTSTNMAIIDNTIPMIPVKKLNAFIRRVLIAWGCQKGNKKPHIQKKK